MTALRSGAAAAWSTTRLFVTRVLVEPVREGRLRDVQWPPGLRPIVAVGLAGYIAAVTLVLGSSIIRQQLELTVQAGTNAPPLPRSVLWVSMALTALAVTLGQSGALHTRAWLRWLVTTFTVLVILLASIPDLEAVPLGRVIAVAACLGLVLFVALRGHRRFAWWEFVVIAVLVWGSFAASIGLVAARSLPLGYDFVPIVVSLVLVTVGQLAIPAAIAAGAAVAELAVSSAVWVAGAFRDKLGRTAVIVLLCVVAVWRVIDLVPATIAVVGNPFSELVALLAAAAFIALIAALWVLLARVRRGGEHPTTAGLIAALSSVSLLIAACITLMIPSAFAQLGGLVALAYGAPDALGDFLIAFSSVASATVVVGGVRSLAGLAMIVIAVVLARRGRPMLPELLAAVGLASLGSGAAILFDLPLSWTPVALSYVATIAAFAMLVTLLLTRRITMPRITAITGALLIAALFEHRDWISDPLAAVLGSAAIATVLLGFVWSLLTGYGQANTDSARYPRPARVQLVLANAVFGATVLAYSALARDPDSIVNLADFAEYGGRVFGDALIAGSLLTAYAAAAFNRKLG